MLGKFHVGYRAAALALAFAPQACVVYETAPADDDDAGSSVSASSSASSSSTGAGGTQSMGAAPQIVELKAAPPTLKPAEQLTITAKVSDADGVTDISGGVLTSIDGTKTYGSFGQVAPGEFAVSVDWAQLNQLEAIEFVAQETRTLRALFTDHAQNQGSGTVDVVLSCSGKPVCNGVCLGSEGEQSSCNDCNKAGTCDGAFYEGVPAATLCPVSKALWDTLGKCACSQCGHCEPSSLCGGSGPPSTTCGICAGEACPAQFDNCSTGTL